MLKVKQIIIKYGLAIALLSVTVQLVFGQQVAPDPVLLGKFELLCKQIARTEGNYTLGGEINIVDKANPDDQMDHVPFLFCKRNNEFYYRLGKTATINEQNAYIYIDYLAKSIWVSPQKRVVYDIGMQSFADLGGKIKSEHYRLTSKINGDEQTFSLINEHHISCKEYTIICNKNNLKIKRLYMRLTNFNDPLNADKEKKVTVSIFKWNDTADLTQYLTKDKVIKQMNGRLKAINEFKDYRLIQM